VQIGSTFNYSNYTVTIVGYGWTPDGYPYVLVLDSYDGSYHWVSMGGDPLVAIHPRPGAKVGDMVNLSVGFRIVWDGSTDTIGVALWSSDLILGATYYEPIPFWEIP
jgi:hypothetical protein